MPRFLYHGTSAKHIPAILGFGLQPRWERAGNWEHTVKSGDDRIYLTDAYPLYFACHAADNGHGGAVIEIDTEHVDFDASNLVADEDFLEQATRGRDFAGKPKRFGKWTMLKRTEWFRDRPGEYGDAEMSLEHMGTCAHMGEIPSSTITRIATIDASELVRLSLQFDPMISIMNYRLMKRRYRSVPGWLFDGTPVMDSFCPGVEDRFQPERTGISVQCFGRPVTTMEKCHEPVDLGA